MPDSSLKKINTTKWILQRTATKNGIAVFAAAVLALASCQTAPKEYTTPPEVIEANSKTAQAWEKLWANDFAGANEGFSEAAKVLKSSAEVYRGQGLANFALGKVFESAESFMKAIQLDPTDPTSAVAHRFIDVMIPYKKDLADRLFVLDNAIVQNYPGTAISRTAAKYLAEYDRDNLADLKAFQTQTAFLNYVDHWWLLGPFPNGSGQGFDRSFIVENSRSSSLPAVEDSQKNWLQIDAKDPGGMVTVGERMSPSAASVIYAGSEIIVPKESSYRFVFDAAGAIKVWIDGGLIYVDSDYSAGVDQGWVETKFKPGKHRILVKIAERTKNSWFRVSATPFDPAKDKIPLAVREQGNALLDGVPAEERNPTLSVLSLRLQKDSRAEDAFWLGWELLDAGQIGGLENEIYGTAVASPRKPSILSALPENSSFKDLLISNVHAERSRPDDARNVFVRSVDAGSVFAPAYDYLIDEAADDDRLDEMDRLISKSIVETGIRFKTSLAQYRLNLLENKPDDAESTLKSINTNWPGTSAAYLLQLANSKNKSTTAKLAGDLKAIGMSFQSNLLLLNQADDSGDYANAAKLVALLQQLAPNNRDLVQRNLEFGFRTGKISFEQFVKQIGTYGEQYPASFTAVDWVLSNANSLWTFLDEETKGSNASKIPASIKLLVPDLDVMRQTYAERELALRPTNFALRTELSRWKKARNPNELAKVADPLSLVSTYLTKPLAAEGDAQILSDEIVELQFADGGYHSIHSLLMKINTTSGVRQESTQRINGRGIGYDYKILMAYTVKPDGSRVRAKDGNWSVNFPSLSTGDYLVMVYELDGARTGSLAPYLWTSFTINDVYPVKHRSYKLYYPDNNPLKVSKHRIDPELVKESDTRLESGTRLYSIEANDIKPLDWNLSLSDGKDVYSWIDMSSVPDWGTIAAWYSDIAYGRTSPTPAIQKKVAELTKGLKDRGSIIQKLFAYAASDIAYEDLNFQYSAYVPQWAESVASDGFGDCKDKCALLLSLLDAAGIQGEIALSEPDYAGDEYFLPSPRFSHVITFIGSGENQIVLDPTSDLLTYPNLPAVLTGTSYLRIPRVDTQNAALQRVTPAKAQRSEIVVRLTPDRQNWNVQGNFTLRGDHAAYLRQIAESKDPVAQKRDLVAMLNSILPGIVLTSYKLDVSEGLDYNPVLTFDATVDRGQSTQDSKMIFTPSWFLPLPSGLSTRIALKGDNSPFEMRYPMFDTAIRQTWIVTLPDGYRLGQAVNQELRFGDSYIIHRGKLEGRTLVQERESYVPSGRIPPADVESFTSFIRRAAQADRQPDIFEKQ